MRLLRSNCKFFLFFFWSRQKKTLSDSLIWLQWLHSHFVFSLDPYKIYIVNTYRDFSLCNIWYFLYIWKVTFECVWALEVKYVFTAIPKKPCWRAPKCFEPLINDKLPQPPPPPSPPPLPVSSAEEKQFALGDPMQSVVLHGFRKKSEKKRK